MFRPVVAAMTIVACWSGVARAQTPERGGPVASTVMGPARRVRPGPHVAMPPVRDPASVVIRLERSECFGPCPVYSVELRGTGEIRYEGFAHVLVTGEHRAAIAPERVQALLKAFEQNEFWSLRPNYIAPITDNPGYRLTVTIDGASKTVNDYVGGAVGMPAAVTALEDMVDKESGADRWVTGNGETLPALHSEGWDFHSPEAGATLARAAGGPNDTVALALLDAGAPVTGSAVARDDYGHDASALEGAATMARLPLLRRLVAMGAAAGPAERNAALFAAVASAHPEAVAEILKLGPDVNATNAHGDTPLIWVESGPHPFYSRRELTDPPGVIRMLIAAGADPKRADARGDTVLHHTLEPANALEYIHGGAVIEARNAAGETPLLATFSEDVALTLIAAGADIQARTPAGLTVRARARSMRWTRVLAKLGGR